MNRPSRDRPEVITLPPLIYLAFGALAAWLQNSYALPCPELPAATGGTLIAAGLVLITIAALQFKLAGTHLEPFKPALTLVTTGVYKWTRNPIYLGFLTIYLGFALLYGNPWMVILALPLSVAVTYGIILPEERYLAGKFGTSYTNYQVAVRRWL